MAFRHLCRLLAVLLLPAAACTVLGDEAPGLDELEAVLPIDIDVGAIRPASCDFYEDLEIEVTNSASRDITVWSLFSWTYQWPNQDRSFTTDPSSSGPFVLAPGERHTFGASADMNENGFLKDITSARVFASNMDPSDPEPPAVTVSWTDRCESSSATWLRVLPVAFDPGNVANAPMALTDITPENCPDAELSGALVENRAAEVVTAWAAWTLDAETLGEDARSEYGDQVTVFAPPVAIEPGSQFRFEAETPPGVDQTDVTILTNEPAARLADLGISWLDTCALPSSGE